MLIGAAGFIGDYVDASSGLRIDNQQSAIDNRSPIKDR
jgi:hypothetical protein